MNEFNEDQDILTAALPSLSPIRQSGPEIKELYAALFAAKQLMSPVKKTAENDFFNSRYADLLACMKSWEPPLEANGLMLLFFPVASKITGKVLYTAKDGSTEEIPTVYASVIGRLIHVETGQWIEAEIGSTCKAGGQAVGSLVTYAKRYLGQAVLSLPSADDDGNAAQATPQAAATPTKAGPSSKPAPQPDQAGALCVETTINGVGVKEGTGKNGPWTKYTVMTPAGSYSTFDYPKSEAAKAFSGTNEKVTIEYRKTQYGNDMLAISAADEVPF